MIVIGIGNKARQGKNVFAKAMVDAAKGRKATVYAFADELRRYCAAHHDELFEKYPHVSREQKADPIYGYVGMLQFYGTEIARAADPDVWVKALASRIAAEAPEIAIIADLRFLNEAKFVQDKGGVLIKLSRVRDDGTQVLDPKRDPKHASEVALDDFGDWDFEITCLDGEVEALQESGRIVIQEILDVFESAGVDTDGGQLVLPAVSGEENSVGDSV